MVKNKLIAVILFSLIVVSSYPFIQFNDDAAKASSIWELYPPPEADLTLAVLYYNGTMTYNQEWASIDWGQVQDVAYIAKNVLLSGFDVPTGSIIYNPMTHDEPLFYIYEKFWGQYEDVWYNKFISSSTVTNIAPYKEDDRLGYTGILNIAGFNFQVMQGVKVEYDKIFDQGLSRLKTNITTPVDLQNVGLEYNFYLNPSYRDEADDAVYWVRYPSSEYVYIDPVTLDVEYRWNYTDMPVSSLFNFTEIIEDLPSYEFDFLNYDKTKQWGHFDFNDLYKNATHKYIVFEETVLPGGIESYVIKVGATYGALNGGDTLVIDPAVSWGGESVFNSATSNYNSICALDSSKIAVAYTDAGNSNYGTVRIATVSGTTPSWGGESAFNSAASYYCSICALNSSAIAVAYSDNGNSNYGTVCIATVSGTTPSWGGESAFNSATTTYVSICALNSSAIAVAYTDNGNSNYGTVRIATVSGTTPSWGGESAFNSATTGYISICALNSSAIAVAYVDGGNSDYGTVRIATVSGTTPSWGGESAYNSASTSYSSICALDSSKIAVVYRDIGNSNYGTVRIATVSGTTPSWGGESVFNPATISYGCICALDSSTIAVKYMDAGNSSYGTGCIATVSGTTPSWGGECVFNPATTTYSSICALDGSKIAVAYRDGGNSDYGTVCMGNVTGLNTAPIMDSFAVDSDGGSGWDLDNNDVQVDFSFTDADGDTIDLYFTFKKGSQAREPTTADYDARILSASNQSNYDLDWTGGSWSDYDGEVYVRVVAWDGTDYSDDDPLVLNVDYDYLDYGIDGAAPTTSVNQTATYRITTATTGLEAAATDSPSVDTIDYVTLYYRFSEDNTTWGSWAEFGSDNTPSPWGWTFTFPDGTGYYQFYSRGTDEAGNIEAAPGSADEGVLHNTAPTINDEYPDNESTIGTFTPECYVRVVDGNYDLLDVYFYENTTGSWVLKDSFFDVASNSYQSFDYDEADAAGSYYGWKVAVNDSHENVTAIYWFNISSGGCPYPLNVIPSMGADVTTLYTPCQFDAMDPDGGTVDYDIWENTTGAWVKRAFGTVDANDTIFWTFNQADAFNETYYWRINLTDGNCSESWIYFFNLNLEPPYNLEVTSYDDESITLGWDKGAGSTHTLILFKTGGYPSDPSDGTASTAYFGAGTSATVAGLSASTSYYFRAWSYLSGDYSLEYDQVIGTTSTGGEEPSGPSDPGGFTVSNIDETERLLLQWNLGDDDYVHIRRDTSTYPLTIGDGTFVYNGSGALYYDPGLTPGELYYYSAFFESYAKNKSANITSPMPPEYLYVMMSGYMALINWTNSSEGYHYLTSIQKQNNTAPLSYDDGETCAPGPGTSTTDNTSFDYWPMVYAAFALASEDGYFAYSAPCNMVVDGNVIVNAYDENDGSALSGWNIIVTSNTGGTMYTGYGLDNPTALNVSSYPDADYFTFKVTMTDYYSGWYSYTEDEMDTSVNFPLDAYLTQIGGEGNGSGGDDWYEVLILNEYDMSVEDVRVALYHITNETNGNRTLLSVWYTDNYGEVQFEGIVPGDEYYVNLSKTDFITVEYRWIPGADDHYKTFKIYLIIPEGEDVYNPWDYITFTAGFTSNTTLVVDFEDESGLTLDARFEVYENTSSSIFETWLFYDSSESWTVPYNGTAPHAYRADYRIKLYINNHSYFENFTATIFTVKTFVGYNPTLLLFDTNIAGVAGVPIQGQAVGWVAIIFFCIALFIIVSFGKYWIGVGIAALGLFTAFFATVLGVPGLGVDQLLVFAGYCLIYGALHEIAKNKRGRLEG